MCSSSITSNGAVSEYHQVDVGRECGQYVANGCDYGAAHHDTSTPENVDQTGNDRTYV